MGTPAPSGHPIYAGNSIVYCLGQLFPPQDFTRGVSPISIGFRGINAYGFQGTKIFKGYMLQYFFEAEVIYTLFWT
jgi:hypothetical protein